MQVCFFASAFNVCLIAYARVKTLLQFSKHYLGIQPLGLNNKDDMIIPFAPMYNFPLFILQPIIEVLNNCILRKENEREGESVNLSNNVLPDFFSRSKNIPKISFN